jgi:hypothetical protein
VNALIFHHGTNRFHIVTGKQRCFLKREHTDFSFAIFAPDPDECSLSLDNENFAGFNKNFRPDFCH